MTEKMQLRTLLALALLATMACAPSAFAQTGRIIGTVVDAGTGEPLVGANAIVQGTSVGAATDIDGRFVIRNAPAGPQTLVVSYIGYNSRELSVDVAPGDEVSVDVELVWAGVEGEEVVITAQAQGQLQAINEQLSARSITNVVSAERIRELPDESAAAAVSRLPGVSLQNGDQIVIRGIEAKYNTVTVNGVQLPSTTTNRTTGLGFISSNMLSGIEVAKTVTPAMDANSIGGNVNLRLREAPEGLHYDAMIQGDYNTQDRTADNYRLWASVSNRFLGGKLGAFVQGNARRFNGGGDIASATWQALPQADSVAGRRPYGLNQYDLQDQVNVNNEYGASLLLDYRLSGTGKIVFQSAYSSEDFDNASMIDRLFLTTGNREFRINRTIGSRYLLVNSLQGDHELGNLAFDWSLSHAQSRREDDLGYETAFIGTDYFEAQTLPNWTSEEQVFDIDLLDGNPGAVGDGLTAYEDFGERRLVGALNLSLPVTLGFISGELAGGGKYTTLERDRDLLQYYRRLADGGGQNEGAADYLESIGADPNAALNLAVFNDAAYMDERGAYYLDGRWPFSGALNVDYLDQYFRLAQTGWQTPALAQSNRFDYVAEEQVAAGYVMGDFNVGRYLNVLGGVRYEEFGFNNRAPFVNQTLYDGQGDVRDTLSVERSFGEWFPNVQLQVMPTGWFDIRLAYTKTTSRPDYEFLLPNTWVDSGERGQAGNPNLRPTIANSFDAYVSIHNNRVGLFTFGIFTKKLTDVIRPVSIQRRALENFEGTFWAPVDGDYAECSDGEVRISCEDADGDGSPDGGLVPDINPVGLIETYVNNPYDGRITGFEVDWQTNFWYLPRPLNSLVLNVNYTRLNSEMDYQSIFLAPEAGCTFFCDLVQVDTLREGRLFQQADNVVNVALGVDVGGFSGRVSFRYQGEILAGLDQRDPANDTFTQPIYGWDFSLRQQLPLDGLSLFFNGVNITHPAGYNNRTLVVGPDAAGVTNARTQISYYPRRFQLGIRYGM